MSNSLSIAMATAALSHILAEALQAVPGGGVQNARVTTVRPDMLGNLNGDARGINVFLYEVSVNAAWAGTNLPARRSDGTPVAPPRQALDLHYLLTFSGDESALEPQRLLGVAVTTLVSRPVLSRELLRDVIARARAQDPNTWEQFNDLADQVDLVRFTFQPLSLEELSKLWSTFFQAPYRLSVAYQASVVLVEAAVTPHPALPVLTRGIDVAAVSVPVISRIVPDAAATEPIVPGTTLRIEGERLRGTFLTRVRIGDVEVPVQAGQLGGTRLLVDLPATVPAGISGVRVYHPRMVGTPPVERGGAESNATAILVRPRVTGPVTAAAGPVAGVVDITLPVTPPVGMRQRVVLTLNEHHPPDARPARSYSFAAALLDPAGPATVDSLSVPVTGVTPGEYLVRVQVDGAESVLVPGPDGRFDQPRVTIP